MSGTGHTTKNISSTGDQAIDGILKGTGWDDATIYYSFPSNASQYDYEGEPDTFATLPANQKTAAHRALNTYYGNDADDGFSVEGFTNLNVVHTNATGAHIRLADTDTSPYDYTTAWGFYPNTTDKAGDVWFLADYSDAEAGNWEWHTVYHEIGHALGLKHGQDDGGFGALPDAEDSMEFSVMTYRSYVGDPLENGYSNENWGYAQSYMMADIAALQHMYGANYTVNSGDTVYKWNPNSGDTLVNGEIAIDAGGDRIFATIWDGGGTDTYDLSAYSANLSLNLTPGSNSYFSSDQIADLGDGNSARGNIFNALLHDGDTRSLIENAKGGSGSDMIFGNVAGNVLTGNGGNDTLYGLAGDDTLDGGSGNDILYGGDGNDVLINGSGVDSAYGGNGDDVLRPGSSGIAAGDLFNGGRGIDTLDFAGFNNDYWVDLTSGDFNVTTGGYASTVASIENVTAGNGDDLLTGNGSANELTGNGGNDAITGLGGNDTLNGGAGNDSLYGGDGDDDLTSGSGVDSAYGGAGDDVLRPGSTGIAAGDLFNGGSGIDTLDFAGFSNSYRVDLQTGDFDVVTGGYASTVASIENVTAGNGNDDLTGNGSANVLDGNGGNDTIDGGAGADTLHGGDGDDDLTSGSGADSAYGGNGDDVLRPGSTGITTGDLFNGGRGIDTLDFAGFSNNYRVDLATGDFDVVTGGYASTVASIENVTAGNGDDQLTGNDLANKLVGNGGKDVIDGGKGEDTLIGGAGDDVLTGGSGADSVDGGNGDDILKLGSARIDGEVYDGGAGTDTLDFAGLTSDYRVNLQTGDFDLVVGGHAATVAGIENVIAGDGDDDLTGNTLANDLTGNDGSDTIDGGAGADTLNGGDGNDDLAGGSGADSVSGGDGDDILRPGSSGIVAGDQFDGGSGIDTLDFAGAWNNYRVDLATGAFDLVTGGFAATVAAVENVNAGNGNDELTGNDQANELIGNGGNDILFGGAGGDLLFGGTGDDVFRYEVGEGTDVGEQVTGGAGYDAVELGSVLDSTFDFRGLAIESIEELAFATDGANVDKAALFNADLFGASGGFAQDLHVVGNNAEGSTEEISIDMGAVTNLDISAWTFEGWGAQGDVVSVKGDAQAETIRGTSKTDAIKGRGGSDKLFGNGGKDDLAGGGGKDTLKGGVGKDELTGNGGKDKLFGGTGKDLLNGGGGADLYVMEENAGRDEITGFQNGKDHVKFAGSSSVNDMDDLKIKQVGDDTHIKYDGGRIVLSDISTSVIDEGDFLFT